MGKDWPMIQEAVDDVHDGNVGVSGEWDGQLKVLSGGQFAEIYRP